MPVINLGFIRVVRVEMWSSVCYQLYWAFRYHKVDPPPHPTESDERQAQRVEDEKKRVEDEKQRAEGAQKRAIFLSQTFINWPNPIQSGLQNLRALMNGGSNQRDIRDYSVAVNWNPIKHDINNTCVKDVQEFKDWLKRNYPGIAVNTDDLHREIKKSKLWKNELGYAKLWNGAMLIAVLTVVIGVLTHFRVRTPSHACWILLWLYGGPLFRSKWLVNHSVHNKPCRSFLLWLLYEMLRGVGWIILIVVYCGITLISVELFAEFCGMAISLSAGLWIAVGGIILAVLVLVGLVARYVLHIIGPLLRL